MIFEHPHLAGAHVGRRQEQLDRATFAQNFEVDDAFEHVAQRVQVHRVQLVGRHDPRQNVHDHEDRAVVEAVIARHLVIPRRLERALGALVADLLPEFLELLARTLGPADGQAVPEHRGVHRPGTGGAHRVESDPAILEQFIENAPGESAMGTATLKREIDLLAVKARCVCGITRCCSCVRSHVAPLGITNVAVRSHKYCACFSYGCILYRTLNESASDSLHLLTLMQINFRKFFQQGGSHA